MKIVSKQISSEIITLFLITLLISSMPVIIQRLFKMMDLVVNRGISLSEFVKLIILLLPFILYLVIPFAFLVAVTLCFSRMHHDNEITVLKAAGIGIHQLLQPVLTIALIVSLSSIFLSMYLIPLASASFRGEISQIFRAGIGAGIMEKVFNDNFPGMTIYVNQVSGNSQFRDIFIYDRRDPSKAYIIVARDGELRYDMTSNRVELILHHGSLHQMEKAVETYHNAIFKTYHLTMDLEGLISEKFMKRRKIEMSPYELIQKIGKEDTSAEDTSSYIIALSSKVSYPLSCIVFAIIAIPLGVQAGKIGKYSGFISGIVVSIIYYLLYTGFNGAAEGGKFSPYIAPFMANIILAVIGVYMLVKVSTESQFYPLYLIELTTSFIREKAGSFIGDDEG